jgi:hypothetical protein
MFGVASIRTQKASRRNWHHWPDQGALLIQEPLRAEYLWFTPEVGVIEEAPQVHEYGCVLPQKYSILNIGQCISDYDTSLLRFILLLTLGMKYPLSSVSSVALWNTDNGTAVCLRITSLRNASLYGNLCSRNAAKFGVIWQFQEDLFEIWSYVQNDMKSGSLINGVFVEYL